MSNRNSQNVMIKGTKEGFTLHLDSSGSFREILTELNEKLSVSFKRQKGEPQIKVNIHSGNRIFTEGEKKELIDTIQKKQHLVVDKFYSDVISHEDAKRILNETEIKTIVGMIRSGQVLHTPGDILVIGDVNPGAEVKAAGSVYIIGAVKGNIHAGCSGDKEAVVAASVFSSGRISIANTHTTVADAAPSEEPLELHSAYLNDQDEVTFDRIQILKHLRPNLTRLEGGV
ncbi:MAG: septum site-determining protein MinC [Bacillus sp. (in: firmicutes)]